MKKYFGLFLLFLFASLPMAFADNVYVLRSHVNDYANTMSISEQQDLNNVLSIYEKSTVDHPQIVFLTVPSLPEDGIEKFANDTFHSWGIGVKGKDNGILVVLAPKEHKVRIEVGYGLEPVIPDGVASHIIDTMKPDLKAGRIHQAFLTAFNNIQTYIPTSAAESPTVAPLQKQQNIQKPVESDDGIFGWFFAGIFVLCIGVIIQSMRWERKRNLERAKLFQQKNEEARRARNIRDAYYKPTSPRPYYAPAPSGMRQSSGYSSSSKIAGTAAVVGAAAAVGAAYELGRVTPKKEEKKPDTDYSWGSRSNDDSSSSYSPSSYSSSSSSSDSSFSGGGGDSGGGGSSGDY